MARTATKKAGEDFVQARFEFGYDGKTGRVQRGQVFELGGHVHDEKLIRLGHVAPVEPGTPLCECGECGRLFMDDATREAHGDLYHAFECECGAVPPWEEVDKAVWLQRHRLSCSIVQAAKDKRRQEQLEQIAEQKKVA